MSFIRRALNVSSTGKTLFRNQWKQYVPGNRYMSKKTQLSKTFRKGRVIEFSSSKTKTSDLPSISKLNINCSGKVWRQIFGDVILLMFANLESLFRISTFWWLVRVTLVVDWLFLPQNFGPVVGTYEGLLQLSECTWGGGSICRWWGHLTSIWCHRTFFRHRWWGP